MNNEGDDALGVDEIVRRLPTYFTISCLSARNSGKSVLIQELVKTLLKEKRIDLCLVMSGSAGLNNDFNFLPPQYLMNFDSSILNRLWETQKITPVSERKHVLLVIDDALGTPEAFRDMTLQKIFSQGRHLWLSCAIISQHTTYLLTPIIKGNSDIILWSRLNLQQQKSLWEATTGIDFKTFKAISDKLGGINYNFMLLDNYSKSQSNSYLDFLTFVRASPPEKKDKKNKHLSPN
jgi:hypothetical protein